MRAPKRKRKLKRELLTKKEIEIYEVKLKTASEKANYIGSPEHKKTPSFAGQPRPRSDASICPDYLARKQKLVTTWLKRAIEKGSVADWWEGEFPKYVWFKEENTVYEGRLVNKIKGEYKGWPLNHNEWPANIEDFYE